GVRSSPEPDRSAVSSQSSRDKRAKRFLPGTTVREEGRAISELGIDRRGALGVLGGLGLAGLTLTGCGSSDAIAVAAAEPAAGEHSARRISVAPGLAYEKLVKRFEKTVPVLPVAKMQAAVAGKDKKGLVALLAKGSPLGMYLSWSLDITPFMAVAGHAAKAKSYLMGNPLLASKMYAHDSGVMLYAPLRLLVHTGADGAAQLTFDRPSDLFGSFSSAEIAAVGKEIDAKVAGVLRAMKLEVPPELTA
ncbi:MAG: DUF302 domain-containing protein, partial [Sporichthyaceae bacterium]